MKRIIRVTILIVCTLGCLRLPTVAQESDVTAPTFTLTTEMKFLNLGIQGTYRLSYRSLFHASIGIGSTSFIERYQHINEFVPRHETIHMYGATYYTLGYTFMLKERAEVRKRISYKNYIKLQHQHYFSNVFVLGNGIVPNTFRTNLVYGFGGNFKSNPRWSSYIEFGGKLVSKSDYSNAYFIPVFNIQFQYRLL